MERGFAQVGPKLDRSWTGADARRLPRRRPALAWPAMGAIVRRLDASVSTPFASRPLVGWVAAILLAFLAGCASAPDRVAPRPDAAPSPGAEVGRGKASWYGPGFQGRRTASGERFDMNQLTAAHRTLPFGTRVRVRNLQNGREVVVRINDRGPHIRDRIIDLSKAAGAALDLLHAGEAQVVLTGL